MSQQAADDFAAFTAPDPATQKARKEEQAATAKEKAALKSALRPEQIKAAQNLSESMKSDKEADEKARLITQLSDYVKFIKEFHPERAEFIKAPKNFGPKNSLEELRVWIKDCQQELGKKGGLETIKMCWAEGFKLFEKVNEGGRFGLQMQGIGNVAVNSVTPRQTPEGELVHGPAVPTLAEFAVKHSNWFSTDVDTRVFMMAVEMIAAVHRMNAQQDMNVLRAATTNVSKDTKEKMDAL